MKTAPLSKAVLLCVFSAWLVQAASAQQSVVHFDPAQAKVTFTLDDPLHTVTGTFLLKKSEMQFDRVSGVASGALVIDAKSGQSGSTGRDKKMHKEVIESDKYPEITFTPEKINGNLPASGPAQVKVDGVFHIHGADHPLTLMVPIQVSGNEVKMTFSFDVPYVAWGMKDPSVFVLRVGKSVRIDITATAQMSTTK
jgi:polyisoprenoid-binding protein YceI